MFLRPFRPARRTGAYSIGQRAEFVAKAVQVWITAVDAQTAYITPGSPWENGYIESFSSRLRDAFLKGKFFYTLQASQNSDRSLAPQSTP